MHKELRPEQVDILVGSPAVNDEFSKKVKELDRRLQMNGMYYRDWETLNDRQHDIFTDNLFLDGECAASPEHYVKGAVESCGCPDTEEELHHHSPVLMREIEKQQDMLPDMTVKIGESLNNLNETIDLLLENIILSEQDAAEEQAVVALGSPQTPEEFYNALHALVVGELEQTFPEMRAKKEATLGRGQWELTDTGNRRARKKALEALRQKVLDGSLGELLTNVQVTETPGTGKRAYTQLRVRLDAPIGDQTIPIDYKVELAQGFGAGGTAEGRQESELQDALEEAIAANGGEPITIQFPNGLGTITGVAKIARGPRRAKKGEEGYSGRRGDPKADFVLLDAADNPIYYISAKDGDSPKNFNQWGGFSNIPEEGLEEIRKFAISAARFVMEDREASKTDGDPLRYYDWVERDEGYVLERMPPGEWPKGLVIAKPIQDRMLKLKAVFGDDYGMADADGKAAHGIDYVNTTFQIPSGEEISLEQVSDGDPGVWKPVGFSHIFGPAQLEGVSAEEIDSFIDREMGSGYHPILLIRRGESGRGEGVYDPENAAISTMLGKIEKVPKPMRSVRFGIFPAGNRDITHEMDDDFAVIPVWNKEAATADPECGGWMCRVGDLNRAGGSETPLTDEPFDAKMVAAAEPIMKKPSGARFTRYKFPADQISGT
jgi:hypothetical protein